jgi:ubiquinone/menaquinone biosynthesis C-methylase UbiE
VNCDGIARWYRWLEYIGFGRALERRRFAFLPDVADAQRILVLGEGDGRFLAKLVEQNHTALIDYVDLSEQMLELARSRAGTERVAYHHADALAIPLPAATYDLIVTHFFLDCLDETDAVSLAEKLAAAVQPNAHWIVSEFRDRGAPWNRAIVAVLYFCFRITTGLRTRRLIDHRKIFARQGICLLRDETSVGGLLTSELWTIGSR